MSDALRQLGATEGGWDMPSRTVIEASYDNPSVWAGLPEAKSQFNAVSRFKIPDKTLDTALAVAFGYDSLLAQGEPALAKKLKATYCSDPAQKTIFNYVRRKMHAGLTRPQKMNKVQRLALRQAALTRRRDAQEKLQRKDFPWFGSNPYTGEGSRLAGNYKGLYFSPGGTFGPRGLAAMGDVERQKPTYVIADDVKPEEMVI